MSTTPRTYVYVDGFNLYFRALRDTPHKWVDIQALCEHLLPNNDVQQVKYYTARIRSRGNPQKALRQETYLRALRTLPKVEIHFGSYALKKVWREAAQPGWWTRLRRRLGWPTGMNRRVQVFDPKEKGSDVNLAVHLVNDAWQNRFDVAVILSNDSDLLEAVKIVRRDCKKVVGIINPHRDPNRDLHKEASFIRHLGSQALAACQLPDHIPSTKIYKPTGW